MHVNDAVNETRRCDGDPERAVRPRIDYTDISQPDQQNNPDHLVLKSIQPALRSDLLSIVRDRLPEYDMTGGAENSWNMSMKASMLTDLKNKAVSQAIETIRNRIDALGVSEPTIQEHGLGRSRFSAVAGIDDPGRVKTSCSPRPCLRSSSSWAVLTRASRRLCRKKAE